MPAGGDETRPAIEFLRIEAVPPRALAVGLGQLERVVALACARAFGVVAVGRLPPVPGVRAVVADPEAQPGAAHRLLPCADDIASRPDARGVPGVVCAIERVEIVVMTAQRHEVLDRKSTRLNSRHYCASRMPSYA